MAEQSTQLPTAAIAQAIKLISDVIRYEPRIHTYSEGYACIAEQAAEFWGAIRFPDGDREACDARNLDALVKIGAACCATANHLYPHGKQPLPYAAEDAFDALLSRRVPKVVSLHDAYGRIDGHLRELSLLSASLMDGSFEVNDPRQPAFRASVQRLLCLVFVVLLDLKLLDDPASESCPALMAA